MVCLKNSFQFQNNIAKIASEEVTKFLAERTSVVNVINTEEMYDFQPLGVDLICTKFNNNKLVAEYIEIKSDKHLPINYFLETVGNDKSNKLGGIITTKSSWIFYYYIDIKELHIMKTIDVQNWLLLNQFRFRSATVPTISNEDGSVIYNTVGSIVPCEVLKEEIDVWIIDLVKSEYTYVPLEKHCALA